jgi:hypothetical protein
LNFWKFWIEDAIGVENPFYVENPILGAGAKPGSGISYSLGPFIEAFWGDYYAAQLSRIILLATSFMIYVAALWPLLKNPRSIKNIFITGSPTSQASAAGGIGMGTLLTAFPIPVFRHYLIVAHPLQWLFFVKIALKNLRKPKYALLTVFICNLLLSLHLLYFLHINGGAPGGDYGIAFRKQPRFQEYLNHR